MDSRVPATLRTARMLLRSWNAADAVALQPLLESNFARLAPWIPPHVATPVPSRELAARLAGFADDFAAERAYRYALLTSDDQRVLGEVDLFPRAATGRVPLAAADHVELGYWLDAAATGQGLATEAVHALFEVAATLPGMTHAEIRCDPENAPSAAVARRLGFRLAAVEAKVQVWRKRAGECQRGRRLTSARENRFVVGVFDARYNYRTEVTMARRYLLRRIRRSSCGAVIGALLLIVGCSNRRASGTISVTQGGREFDDCAGAAWCPRMVVIPPGEFDMGSPPNEVGRNSLEGPVRHVRVGAFAAGKFAVTRAQWTAFVAATNRPTRTGCFWTGRTGVRPDSAGSWRDPGFAQDDDHPVVCVTWYDAQDYVHWLSERTGKPYRLPSEAEWEYAARAGTRTPYPWGTLATHDRANYGRDSCCGGLAVGADRWVSTSPVHAFPGNAFGLHDMHGNVLQWVQDCLAPYDVVSSDGSAYESNVPLQLTERFAAFNGQPACSYRIVRGGDWGDPPRMLRSAFRNFGPGRGATLRDYTSTGVGFRVARALD